MLVPTFWLEDFVVEFADSGVVDVDTGGKRNISSSVS
jgi:hypothetical protein